MPTADELLSSADVDTLAGLLRVAAPGREWRHVAEVAGELGELGLGERARAVRDALLLDLPAGYRPAAEVLRAALRRPGFSGWLVWPVSEAVATLACASGSAADLDDGLKLLAELTPRLTSEFALRTFLNTDLARTLEAARLWSAHPDPHVRRLASEGTRPRLPWARGVPALTADPAKTIPILDALRRDDSETVRRSVANHLNDISRIDPELAAATAARWLADPADTTPRLVRHALRTLIKKAHPAALALMGFDVDTPLAVSGPNLLEHHVPGGGDLTFTVAVTNTTPEPARVAIDYVIHFRKANGTQAEKVFKLAERTLTPAQSYETAKRHSFRPITTRRYHPGEHAIELQVNGTRHGRVSFNLSV
ncbi:DNA alkylation repair protein [Sphaerisporangium sp. TRM90804]|uniref:DNA alkylation repair protein n=1 Tax=Sphaerisporangium sp. TRM90804 TaxID=3031113 RepID=UPI0024494FBF|nr:DNA alkylation repair protein [Sphaerisporangium sp. TRM90804]MDH2427548.1 DNA alkylation repair protein [Sphaerisporangium sp. TRM90804]